MLTGVVESRETPTLHQRKRQLLTTKNVYLKKIWTYHLSLVTLSLETLHFPLTLQVQYQSTDLAENAEDGELSRVKDDSRASPWCNAECFLFKKRASPWYTADCFLFKKKDPPLHVSQDSKP